MNSIIAAGSTVRWTSYGPELTVAKVHNEVATCFYLRKSTQSIVELDLPVEFLKPSTSSF